MFIHFLLDITFQRILQFVGPTAFWPTTKILPVWGWWWNINNYISFHFNLLWEKTIDKIFQKAQKTLFWGPFSDFFTQTLAQMNFPGKKKTQIIYYRAKNQKKLMSHSWEKCRTHGQTNRQRWFYRNLRGTEVLLVLHPCKSITYHITLKSWVKSKTYMRHYTYSQP